MDTQNTDPKAAADAAWSRPAGSARSGGGLPLLFWNDITTASPSDRLVRRLIGENTLALIIGEPGCGKSFLATTIGIHVASGEPWFGRPVLQGAALYIAAEGAPGLKNRALAYRKVHNPPDRMPFVIVPATVNLGPSGEGAEQIIAAAAEVARETGCTVRLIIIDTLARANVNGDENDTRDMSRFIAACDRIRDATGATVLIVHHTAKAGGSRGSVALPGAVETIIAVEKREGGRVAKIVKQKDGADGEEIGFTLDVVEIGQDEDGEPITSCVVRPTVEIPKRSPKLTDLQKRAVDALHNLLIERGQPAPEGVTFPRVTLVKIDAFREHLKAVAVTDRDTPATERQQWKRLLQSLGNAGVLVVRGDWCWSTVTGRDKP